MTLARPRPLAGLPPEPFFILSASAQYLGAVVAVRLFDDLAPAGVAWLRVVGAAIVLVAVSAPRLLRGGRWTAAEVGAAAVFGAAVAFMNLTFYLAIDRMDMGKGVAIEFIGPICVAALATRTRRNTWALVFAVGGVALLSGLEIDREPLGLLWIFLASACWAAYIVVGARVARLDRGLAGLGVGLVFGAVLIAPFGAPSSGPAWSSPALLLAAMSVGVLSNVIGYGLEQSILRAIPVRRFSVLLALLPVTATVFGAAFLDQIPSAADLVGIGLVLVGVVVQQRDVIEPPAD